MSWMKWLPWRYLVKRVARRHGFLDPIALLAKLHDDAQKVLCAKIDHSLDDCPDKKVDMPCFFARNVFYVLFTLVFKSTLLLLFF